MFKRTSSGNTVRFGLKIEGAKEIASTLHQAVAPVDFPIRFSGRASRGTAADFAQLVRHPAEKPTWLSSRFSCWKGLPLYPQDTGGFRFLTSRHYVPLVVHGN